MNAKTLARVAILLIAAACASDPQADDKEVEPAPEPPADVAQLAKPAAGPAATEASGAPSQEARQGLAALAPTGEFVSPSSSQVAPKQPGRVAAVYVEEGARVRRGQPLLAMETDYLRLEIQRAEAELARARAAEAEARREFERKQGLLANESIPPATFDRAQATHDQAQAARTAAEVMLATARQRLADSVLRSPINGVVSERRTDVGEHLGDAGVAFVIVQTAPLKLRFSLPERYLGEVRPGQRITAQVEPYPGETFTGTIKTVGGVIDPANRTFFAEAELANVDGRLLPGLFARVTFSPPTTAAAD